MFLMDNSWDSCSNNIPIFIIFTLLTKTDLYIIELKLTNHGGHSTFSFRLPSQKEIILK